MKQLTIIGNIGNDAAIKDINGNRFIEFSVAVNERYKKQDGTQVEQTDWINVSYHNIKIVQHLTRGMKVLVQGKMSVRTYQGQDKQWKSGIQLHAHLIEFLGGGKKENTQDGASQTAATPQPQLADGSADDLPF